MGSAVWEGPFLECGHPLQPGLSAGFGAHPEVHSGPDTPLSGAACSKGGKVLLAPSPVPPAGACARRCPLLLSPWARLQESWGGEHVGSPQPVLVPTGLRGSRRVAGAGAHP